jgi:hypothetical protein
MAGFTTRKLSAAVATALTIGVGGPVVDVAYKCRESRARIEAACGPQADGQGRDCPIATSEACVWGKSLLPVSLGASLLFLGLPAGALAYWFVGRRTTHAVR